MRDLDLVAKDGTVTIDVRGDIAEILLVGVIRRHNGVVWETGVVEETLAVQGGRAEWIDEDKPRQHDGYL